MAGVVATEGVVGWGGRRWPRLWWQWRMGGLGGTTEIEVGGAGVGGGRGEESGAGQLVASEEGECRAGSIVLTIPGQRGKGAKGRKDQ